MTSEQAIAVLQQHRAALRALAATRRALRRQRLDAFARDLDLELDAMFLDQMIALRFQIDQDKVAVAKAREEEANRILETLPQEMLVEWGPIGPLEEERPHFPTGRRGYIEVRDGDSMFPLNRTNASLPAMGEPFIRVLDKQYGTPTLGFVWWNETTQELWRVDGDPHPLAVDLSTTPTWALEQMIEGKQNAG